MHRLPGHPEPLGHLGHRNPASTSSTARYLCSIMVNSTNSGYRRRCHRAQARRRGRGDPRPAADGVRAGGHAAARRGAAQAADGDRRRRRLHRRRGLRRDALAGHGPAQPLPRADELGFHLVEVWGPGPPRHELGIRQNDHIVLSDGTEYDNHLLVWVAGNQSDPVVARHTDLPVDRAGLFRVRADLRIGTQTPPSRMPGRPAVC